MSAAKKYQVFVSSTFWDLKDERQAVIQALLEIDCIPVAMEMFPASDDAQWDLIKRVIDDCDYYIVIIKNRYGSLAPDDISYTEKEYDYAVEKGVPVLGFLHSDPDSVPVKQSETDAKTIKKLKAFREKIETKTRRAWTSPDGLAGAVSRSLIQEMRIRPRPGWVRATEETDPSVVLKLHTRIEELEEELEKAQELTDGTEGTDLEWDPLRPIVFDFVVGEKSYAREVSLGDMLRVLADELRRGVSQETVSRTLRLYTESALASGAPTSGPVMIYRDTREKIMSLLRLMGIVSAYDLDILSEEGFTSPTTGYRFTPNGEIAYLRLMAEA